MTKKKFSKNLNDYILHVPGIMAHDLCDAILEEYEGSDDWAHSRIGDGSVNADIRSCSIIGISDPDICNSKTRQDLDKEIFKCAGNALNKYANKFTRVSIENDSGYDLLRYETGQGYIQHIDQYSGMPRIVSCSFLLNDEYEGGEFGFFDKDKIIRGNKGDAIMFPSNFLYPHEIIPVTSGERYSIITWFQ